MLVEKWEIISQDPSVLFEIFYFYYSIKIHPHKFPRTVVEQKVAYSLYAKRIVVEKMQTEEYVLAYLSMYVYF